MLEDFSRQVCNFMANASLTENEKTAVEILQNWIKVAYLPYSSNAYLQNIFNTDVDFLPRDYNKVHGYQIDFNEKGDRVIYPLDFYAYQNKVSASLDLCLPNLYINYMPESLLPYAKDVTIGDCHLSTTHLEVYGRQGDFITNIPYTKEALEFIIR